MWTAAFRYICRDPEEGRRHHPLEGQENPLWQCRDAFPGFDDLIRGRKVVDFGCGLGFQAIAMAQLGADVTGLEIDARYREIAAANAENARVSVRFLGEMPRGEFVDVVLSQNSMEHFKDPAGALTAMRRLLRPGGLLLITFGLPWYSAYGGHLEFMTALPWAHLLFPERAVMEVRRAFRDDGAKRYEDVPGGLNKMSLARFERLIGPSGMQVKSLAYIASKRLPMVTRVPVIRELLTTRVDCILER